MTSSPLSLDISETLASQVRPLLGRVLVTGASGFLGRNLIHALISTARVASVPIQLYAMTRKSGNVTRDLEHDIGAMVREVVHDLSHPVHGLPEVDLIIHCASLASSKYYRDQPVDTMLPNVVGTYHLLEWARTSSLKAFVFISSGEVYGEPSRLPMQETDIGFLDPATVRACYGESKRCGETMAVAYNAQHCIPTYIARLFHTYGPWMDLEQGQVQTDFIRSVVRGQPITIKSDGRTARPFCHVNDVIRGLFTMLARGKSGQAYNIGNPDALTEIGVLAEKLGQMHPGSRIERSMAADSAYMQSPIHANCPDISKMIALGWRPEIGIDEGFKTTLQWYLER